MDKLREVVSFQGSENPDDLRKSLKETMRYKVGIIRDRKILEEALQEIRSLKESHKRISIEACRASQSHRAGKHANDL